KNIGMRTNGAASVWYGGRAEGEPGSYELFGHVGSIVAIARPHRLGNDAREGVLAGLASPDLKLLATVGADDATGFQNRLLYVDGSPAARTGTNERGMTASRQDLSL